MIKLRNYKFVPSIIQEGEKKGMFDPESIHHVI